ncbi:hypothetical protein TWF281_000062 [Arthrobotrys megalospora]
MSTFIPWNPYLDHHAAALSTLTAAIQKGELYRNVTFYRLSPSIQSELSPQNRELTSLLKRLLTIGTFLRHYAEAPLEYAVKAEAFNMGFTLSDYNQTSFFAPMNITSIEQARPLLTVQASPSATNPRTFISLFFTSPSLVRNIQPTTIHDDVDYDIQFTFSYLPYLEEAYGPIFEVCAVMVQRRDVGEWLRMARAKGRFDDTVLEIVRGPTRVIDEAGECWVVSLVLI